MLGYTTFPEYILNCLYCLFVEAPRLWVFGTDSRVGKFVLCGKLFKFFRGVLRAVIRDDCLMNAVSTEEGLDFIDNSSGFGFPEVLLPQDNECSSQQRSDGVCPSNRTNRYQPFAKVSWEVRVVGVVHVDSHCCDVGMWNRLKLGLQSENSCQAKICFLKPISSSFVCLDGIDVTCVKCSHED